MPSKLNQRQQDLDDAARKALSEVRQSTGTQYQAYSAGGKRLADQWNQQSMAANDPSIGHHLVVDEVNREAVLNPVFNPAAREGLRQRLFQQQQERERREESERNRQASARLSAQQRGERVDADQAQQQELALKARTERIEEMAQEIESRSGVKNFLDSTAGKVAVGLAAAGAVYALTETMSGEEDNQIRNTLIAAAAGVAAGPLGDQVMKIALDNKEILIKGFSAAAAWVAADSTDMNMLAKVGAAAAGYYAADQAINNLPALKDGASNLMDRFSTLKDSMMQKAGFGADAQGGSGLVEVPGALAQARLAASKPKQDPSMDMN